MKKHKNLVYIFIGLLLAFILQSIMPDKINATDINTTNHYNDQKIESGITTNFVNASQKAIKSVVHIKSKYLSN